MPTFFSIGCVPLNQKNIRLLSFDSTLVLKDLRNSLQGVDAESFQIRHNGTAGVNLKKLLTDQRIEFQQFVHQVGQPVFRMMDYSRYSWRSAKATDALRGVENIQSFISWYPPDEFHAFCKENNIKLIGYFDFLKLYDPLSGEVTHFLNDKTNEFNMTSSQMKDLVQENMYKLNWVKEHGYSDLYLAWEIGNESYLKINDYPEIYAAFVKQIVRAAREIDPDIRLAINIFACAGNDNKLHLNELHTPPKSATRADLRHRYKKNIDWSIAVLANLGEDAQLINYCSLHLYGGGPAYNANIKGLHSHQQLIMRSPNSRHMRFLVTEWRYTGSNELTKHREYHTSALWNAKFSMVLLSHPLVDATAIHEFLTFSGTGYWNDGDLWKAQYQSNNQPHEVYKSSGGDPHLDIGPFGPVLNMLNRVVRNYPLLLTHKSKLGPMSSAIFFSKCKTNDSINNDCQDLDWIVAKNRKRDDYGGIIVNTYEQPINIMLKDRGRKKLITKVESLSCLQDKLFLSEIPGKPKFWKVYSLVPHTDGTVTLPPFSVTFFEAY